MFLRTSDLAVQTRICSLQLPIPKKGVCLLCRFHRFHFLMLKIIVDDCSNALQHSLR